jgi:hypothetical protein
MVPFVNKSAMETYWFFFFYIGSVVRSLEAVREKSRTPSSRALSAKEDISFEFGEHHHPAQLPIP